MRLCSPGFESDLSGIFWPVFGNNNGWIYLKGEVSYQINHDRVIAAEMQVRIFGFESENKLIILLNNFEVGGSCFGYRGILRTWRDGCRKFWRNYLEKFSFF